MVEEQWDDDHRQDDRHNAGRRPEAPAQRDVCRVGCELRHERIRRTACQESCCNRRICLKRDDHEERANLSCRRARLRAEDRCQTADNREHNAARPRRVRRRCRTDDEVAENERVAELETAAAEESDQLIRDAPAESRLDEALGKQECADDQPDGRIAVAGQCLSRLDGIRQSCQCDTGQRHRAKRHRLQDEAHDHRRKNRKQMPGSCPKPRRHRTEPQHCQQSQRQNTTLQSTHRNPSSKIHNRHNIDCLWFHYRSTWFIGLILNELYKS